MKNIFAYFIVVKNNKSVDKLKMSLQGEHKVIVGRDKSRVDFVIGEAFISRVHFEIFNDKESRIFIKDLASTNGVFLNGKRILATKYYEIKYGDIISLNKDSNVKIIYQNPKVTNLHEAESGNVSLNGFFAGKRRISIGRSHICDYVIDSRSVSRIHAFIEKVGKDDYLIIDNKSTNGTYVNGEKISRQLKISANDRIKIGEKEITPAEINLKSKANKYSSNKLIDLLTKKGTVIIGRNYDCDIQIPDNIVSRHHARITKSGNNFFIEDLNSANGTFLNDKKIKKKSTFDINDIIRIGFTEFRLDKQPVKISDYTAIRAVGISKKYDNNYTALHPMTFSIPSESFIAVMGPSGCGKTTLMNILNGSNPASKGEVYIHGLKLSGNYDLLKQKIGYVPQDDIVHKELTVNESIYYAAKLRMNEDTTEEEIKKRIDEVCTSLNINEKSIRENKVKNLSGGQRKRVSIAVELLTKPTVLFLDEPTSPLDPETIESFLKSIRELTYKEKTTVIMVTHKPSDLHFVDKVIFLARKGYPAFYGDEKDLYSYFEVDKNDIIGVYSKLSDENQIKNWYSKWQQSNINKKTKENPDSVNKKIKTSIIRQYYWLTKRYLDIKINDKANMLILIAQPLVIPIALIYIFSELRLGVLFMMAISAIWFGISNAAKEIVDEIPIYNRERMYNLNISAYILSKITILSLIAFIQVAIFVLIIKSKFVGGEIYLANPVKATLFMFYLAFSATLIGLVLSALFKNSEQVMSIIPIVLIPQIILAGVITDIDTKDKEVLSYFMLGRWGTEGLSRIQNDDSEFKKYLKQSDTYFLINNKKVGANEFCLNDKNNESECIKTESVYSKMPAFYSSKDTLIVENNGSPKPYTKQRGKRLIKTDPIKTLGFYENKSLLNIFDSFNKNIMVITILNFVSFCLLKLSLKKKDKI